MQQKQKIWQRKKWSDWLMEFEIKNDFHPEILPEKDDAGQKSGLLFQTEPVIKALKFHMQKLKNIHEFLHTHYISFMRRFFLFDIFSTI